MADEEPRGTDATISARAATPELDARGLAGIAAFDQGMTHDAVRPDATLDLPAGDQVASAGALDPGQIIGHFVIKKRLGEGGMGLVLAGEDPDLGRPVAIKVVKDSAQHPAYRERLLREAKVMARLEHPNVVRVYEVGSDRGRLFVAMELVDGVTLAAWLALERRTWRETLAIFQQVGAGLSAVHRAGLVHRDFKPDNVLVDREGRARVADFGLARLDPDSSNAPALGASLTRTGMMVGTPAYMAPEQHFGGNVDARADQYSFCISLREALIGSRPKKIVDAHWGEVPRAVRAAITRGAAVDVSERFASIDELLAALSRGSRRRGMWIAAAAAVVVVAASAGAALSASSDDAPAPVAQPAQVEPAPIARPPVPVAPPASPSIQPAPVVVTERPAAPQVVRKPSPAPKAVTQVGETVISPMAPVHETAAAKQHNLDGNGKRREMIAAHRGAVRGALRDLGYLGVTITGDDRDADLRELEDKLAASTDDLERGVFRYAMGLNERLRDNCSGAAAHWAAGKKLVAGATRDQANQPRRAQAFLFLGRIAVNEAYCALLGGRALGVADKLHDAQVGMWSATRAERAEVWLAEGIALHETGDEERGKALLRQAASESSKVRAAVLAYASAVGLAL